MLTTPKAITVSVQRNLLAMTSPDSTCRANLVRAHAVSQLHLSGIQFSKLSVNPIPSGISGNVLLFEAQYELEHDELMAA